MVSHDCDAALEVLARVAAHRRLDDAILIGEIMPTRDVMHALTALARAAERWSIVAEAAA